MRLLTPEISWHQREPIYSLDFQQQFRDFPRLATVGVDGAARIWRIDVSEKISTEYLATVRKDCGALNTVRFSPDGDSLAFCGVSAVIYIGQQSTSGPGDEDSERWTCRAVLRGHLYDVQVLEWAADSKWLVSGSVDNSVILWNVEKGQPLSVIRDSRGFVQGVCFDPLGRFVASLGNDRVLRVYVAGRKPKLLNAVSALEGRMWNDEFTSTLFRRMDFSPDGQIMVAPSGTSSGSFTSYVFSRLNFGRPMAQLPHPSAPTLSVRFHPHYFALKSCPLPWINSPYRQIFAVASVEDVLLYDTQQRSPFASVSGFHCTSLSDLTWSPDGRLLSVSSTDGFVSFIVFGPDELGEVYSGETNSAPKRSCIADCADLDQ